MDVEFFILILASCCAVIWCMFADGSSYDARALQEYKEECNANKSLEPTEQTQNLSTDEPIKNEIQSDHQNLKFTDFL